MTVVAITGGARGIGRAIAEALAAGGAKVAIGDIDAELAKRTVADIPGVLGLPLDVADLAAFETFLGEVERQLGPVGVLVNNAGIMPIGPFLNGACVGWQSKFFLPWVGGLLAETRRGMPLVRRRRIPRESETFRFT